MMKKTLTLICALFALVACNLDIAEVIENPVLDENQDIKVNITITRSDISPDTKSATVKTGWANNDVVFVFFNGLTRSGESAVVKYLELKYDATATSDNKWGAKLKGGLTETDILNTTKLTAIYMPYYSDHNPYYHSDNTIYFQPSYNGYGGVFYKAQEINFTYDSELKELKANINLVAAVGSHTSWTGDKLVHFDVKGLNSSHTYYMTQDYMNCIEFTIDEYGASVITVQQNGWTGSDIPGYYDADPNNDGNTSDAIMSFSGVLDASAVGNNVEYRFLIHDKTDNSVYFYNAGNHKIDTDTKISLGNISKWNHIENTPYFTVGSTQLATFAPGNLQATYNNGTWTWGFAASQYTVLNENGKNTAYDATTGEYNGENGTVDLFSWVGASSELSGVAAYGIFSSTNNADFGTGADELLKQDWGTTIDNKGTWKTLTKDNLSWLVSKRRNCRGIQNTVGGVSKACYAKGKVNGISGLILFPNNYQHPSSVTAPTNINEETVNFDGNNYSTDDWSLMQSAGAVFLPTTKYRLDGGLKGGAVLYWANSAYSTDYAYRTNTTSNQFNIPDQTDRRRGLAVRLIHYLN